MHQIHASPGPLRVREALKLDDSSSYPWILAHLHRLGTVYMQMLIFGILVICGAIIGTAQLRNLAPRLSIPTVVLV